MARLSFGSMPPAQVRLDGIRIAVKDNMHLWGLRTSIGSKAYHEWHGTRMMNAACVASLMKAGAQIVGKTHLSAFAAMDHPTQGREFQAPTNVRGDRFQICGGSSDGTAAALAAYDWLDAGIGTDTAGGMRFPAHQTGLFSLRTSSGLISSDGIVEAWERLHIPGVMARDLGVISQILDVWHHAQTRRPEDDGHRRVVLLIPREYTMVLHDREQESIMLQFVGELCGRLGCEYRTMSIEEDWPLLEFGGEPLPDFFYSLVTRGWWHAHYQSFHDFREAFRFKNLIYPYTTDHVSQMWEVGSSVTDADHEGMNRRIEEFREWFLQRYFSDPGERVFFMFPVADVEPRYRDAPQPKNIPIVHELPMSYIAPILGAPELVVPIGEIWFTSQRTRDREALPVVASFMSTPGTDRELVKWVMEALRICGRPTEVKTGSRAVDTPRPYG